MSEIIYEGKAISVNHYWLLKRNVRTNEIDGSRYISKEGKDFKLILGWLYRQSKGKLYENDVSIDIFYSYISRPCDIDNILKPVLDSLKGLAYNDDRQVMELTVTKCKSEKDFIKVNVRGIKEDEK